MEELETKHGKQLVFHGDDVSSEESQRVAVHCWMETIQISRMPPLYIISWRRTVDSQHATQQL